MDVDEIDRIVARLGAAQKRAIVNLSGEFGASGEHAAATRLWYRDDIPPLLDHRHKTNDCWALRPLGLAVRARLLEQDHG